MKKKTLESSILNAIGSAVIFLTIRDCYNLPNKLSLASHSNDYINKIYEQPIKQNYETPNIPDYITPETIPDNDDDLNA